MNHLRSESDILVVGGGPAGLAAAIAARLRGFRVTLADAGPIPQDKACGEGVMPEGTAALRSLGISLSPRESFAFRGVRFIDGKLSAQADFHAGQGVGVRRTVLHRLLAERARELGVALHWHTAVREWHSGAVQVGGRRVRAARIIGADGHHSRVRRWAGLEVAWSSKPRVGIRGHFRVKPWTDFIELYCHNCCQAYVTPVAPDEVCVALIGSGPRAPMRMDDLPWLFPTLADRLKDARPTDPIKGSLSVSTRLRSVTSGAFALIGDASGSVDAITGDGLSMAFGQALALAEALANDQPMLYEAAHRRITRTRRLMARLMLAMDNRPALRGAALRALAARPDTLSRLLAVHVGVLAPAAMLLDAVGLAWSMLRWGRAPV